LERVARGTRRGCGLGFLLGELVHHRERRFGIVARPHHQIEAERIGGVFLVLRHLRREHIGAQLGEMARHIEAARDIAAGQPAQTAAHRDIGDALDGGAIHHRENIATSCTSPFRDDGRSHG